MANYEDLDPHDAAICAALEAGTVDSDIMDQFAVSIDKLDQLRPVVAERTAEKSDEEVKTDAAPAEGATGAGAPGTEGGEEEKKEDGE